MHQDNGTNTEDMVKKFFHYKLVNQTDYTYNIVKIVKKAEKSFYRLIFEKTKINT